MQTALFFFPGCSPAAEVDVDDHTVGAEVLREVAVGGREGSVGGTPVGRVKVTSSAASGAGGFLVRQKDRFESLK